MKFTPAKCPSCGANIEVNENLEKTICQYCGTTVLIQDAIQKYKIEVSGKVKVDGILGKSELLEQAKNHIKLEEYREAEVILRQIISYYDRFDIEVYAYLLKVLLKDFELREEEENIDFWGLGEEYIDHFDEKAGRFRRFDDFEKNTSKFSQVDEISDIYVRIKKLDEKNEISGLLGDDLKKVIHFNEISEQLKKDEDQIFKAKRKFDEIEDEISIKLINDEYFKQNSELIKQKMYQIIKDDLMIDDDFEFEYDDLYQSHAEYQFAYLSMIQRDGSIITNYTRTHAAYNNSKYSLNRYFSSKEKAKSVEEVISRINKLTEDFTNLSNNPKSVGKKGIFSKLFGK